MMIGHVLLILGLVFYEISFFIDGYNKGAHTHHPSGLLFIIGLVLVMVANVINWDLEALRRTSALTWVTGAIVVLGSILGAYVIGYLFGRHAWNRDIAKSTEIGY